MEQPHGPWRAPSGTDPCLSGCSYCFGDVPAFFMHPAALPMHGDGYVADHRRCVLCLQDIDLWWSGDGDDEDMEELGSGGVYLLGEQRWSRQPKRS